MENLVKIENQQIVTDSRQIAENFGKQHKHVIEAIENIKAENSALTSFFYEGTYKAGTGKSYKMYLMNRDGFTLLAMGFTGKQALEWKLKYIKAFNEMEAELKAKQEPKSQIDILVESAKALQRQERELARLKLTQEEQAESLRIVNSRMDTLNGVCTEGTKRQKLVAMVQKYAISNGLAFNRGWHDFRQAYNTAFHTNLRNSQNYYCEKQGIKKISTPDFLERKGYLDDAMRIMDKLLAQRETLLN
jgi:Rha family phage regulatory protein